MHVVAEIRRLPEENISISCQALTYAGKGMVAIQFFPES